MEDWGADFKGADTSDTHWASFESAPAFPPVDFPAAFAPPAAFAAFPDIVFPGAATVATTTTTTTTTMEVDSSSTEVLKTTMDVEATAIATRRATMETETEATEQRHATMERTEETISTAPIVPVASIVFACMTVDHVAVESVHMSSEEDPVTVKLTLEVETDPITFVAREERTDSPGPEEDGLGGGGGTKSEAGAFWDFFGSSEIEGGAAAVMRRESFSLGDLLDEDDVLEELAGSLELMELVLREDMFSQLVQLIITEGASLRHRFVACQILCFHLVPIGDAFFRNDKAHLLEMVTVLDRPQPLPVLSIEYCARALVRLLRTHAEDLMQVLKDKPSILIGLCRNVGRPGCANVLAALMEANCALETDEGSGAVAGQKAVRRLNAGVAQWLASTGMVTELMRALLPGPDEDAPGNAVSTIGLCLSSLPPDSPLLLQISGPVALTLVLESLQYFERVPASFRAGVDLSVMIMCCKQFDKVLISTFAPEVWRAVEPHVETLSGRIVRLGSNKYELVQLCSALTLIGDPNVEVGLREIHLPRVFANLVAQFPRNNMLHSACTHFFSASLKGALQPLTLSDDVAGVFISRLAHVIDDWPVVADRGFLVQFCTEVLALTTSNAAVEEYVQSNLDWSKDFVEKLVAVQAREKAHLCDIVPDGSLRAVAPLSKPFENIRPAENSPSVTRIALPAPPKANNRDDGVMVASSPPLESVGAEDKGEVSRVGSASPIPDAPLEDVEAVAPKREPSFGEFPATQSFAPKEEVSFGEFAFPKEDMSFGDFATPKEEFSFGEFATPKDDVSSGAYESPKDNASVGEFEPQREEIAFGELKEEPSFGAFGEPKHDVSFGDFAEAKQEVSFGEFAASSEGAHVEDYAVAKDEASFGAFEEPKDDVSFGAFEEPKEEVSFGAFEEPKDVSFGAFEAPTEEVAFGAFDETPAAPAEVTAAPTPAAAGSWAAFSEEKSEEPKASTGAEEAAQLSRVFRKLFPVFPAGKENAPSLGALSSSRDLSALCSWKSDGAMTDGTRVSQQLLMKRLEIAEPPPPPAVAPVTGNLPTPPPMRLTPPPLQSALESPTMTRPSEVMIPATAVLAAPAPAHQLTSEDFGFLSTLGGGSGPAKKAQPTSNSLDFLFGGTSAPAPVLTPEQARDALVSELVNGLSDLSFMLSDTLVVPAKKQESLLSFFE